MALNFGNILKAGASTAMTSGASIASDFIHSALPGVNRAIGGLINETISTAVGFDITGGSEYQSPYPLGSEWQNDPAYTATLVFTDPNTGQVTSVSGYMPETISMSFGAEFSSPLEGLGETLGGGDGAMGVAARLFGFRVSSNLFSMLLWSGTSQVDLTLEMRFVALQDTFTDVVMPIRKLASLTTPIMESFSQTGGAVQLGMVKAPGPILELADSSISNNVSNTTTAISQGANGVMSAGKTAVDNIVSNPDQAGSAVVDFAGSATQAVGGAINNALKNIRVKNNISLMLGTFCYLRSVVVKDVTPAYNIKCDDKGMWTEATVSVQISTFVSPTNLDIPNMVGYGAGADSANSSGSSLTALSSAMSAVTSKLGIDVPNAITPYVSSTSAVNPNTAVKTLYSDMSSNLSKIGKDSGLGNMVKSTAETFKLGMMNADISKFTSKFF